MKTIGLVPELLVSDIKKSSGFYLGMLEFELVFGREEEGFIYLKKGNAEIMLEQIGIGRNWVTKDLGYPLGRGANFQIEVENVDGLYDLVKKNQVPIFLPMEEKWYRHDNKEQGNRQFLVQDPDGYLFRFYKDLGTRDV